MKPKTIVLQFGECEIREGNFELVDHSDPSKNVPGISAVYSIDAKEYNQICRIIGHFFYYLMTRSTSLPEVPEPREKSIVGGGAVDWGAELRKGRKRP